MVGDYFRYSFNCSPCLVDFDAVVKLETAEKDEVFFYIHFKFLLVSTMKHFIRSGVRDEILWDGETRER